MHENGQDLRGRTYQALERKCNIAVAASVKMKIDTANRLLRSKTTPFNLVWLSHRITPSMSSYAHVHAFVLQI